MQHAVNLAHGKQECVHLSFHLAVSPIHRLSKQIQLYSTDSWGQGLQGLHFASEVTYFATQYADASPLKLDQLKLTAMMQEKHF